MLQEIDGWDLIPGQLYFIQNHILNTTVGKATMIRYTDIGHTRPIGLFNAESCGPCLIRVDILTFFRYVSIEEYKQKLKQKYDATCLDIILKRIINETFTW
jgi:hypothetical protein